MTLSRRGLAAASMVAVLGGVLLLAGCAKGWQLDPQDVAVKNKLPPLKFALTDADTGKTVTAADFRGKIVMLFFGYTNCQDVCPLTMSDTVRVFHIIGKKADDIRFLFVTVDPRRDTLPVLRKYTADFDAKNMIGLRGSEAELRKAASRYHATFSVHPSPDPAKYTVMHTAEVYVFNRQGKPEFLTLGFATKAPDLEGIAADLKHLVIADNI